jgi:hypothetical protein
LQADNEVIEIAADRRRLESLKSAVADTLELYAQCKVTMQESQQLLQQADDLLMRQAKAGWRKARWSEPSRQP